MGEWRHNSSAIWAVVRTFATSELMLFSEDCVVASTQVRMSSIFFLYIARKYNTDRNSVVTFNGINLITNFVKVDALLEMFGYL
jgi:hypothetical protein